MVAVSVDKKLVSVLTLIVLNGVWVRVLFDQFIRSRVNMCVCNTYVIKVVYKSEWTKTMNISPNRASQSLTAIHTHTCMCACCAYIRKHKEPILIPIIRLFALAGLHINEFLTSMISLYLRNFLICFRFFWFNSTINNLFLILKGIK